jgi:hypothetical protein
VQQWLKDRPLDRLRTVRKLLRLAETYTPGRLEQACARALRFETAAYRSIKQILQKGLEADDLIASPPPDSAPPLFARTIHELLAGGA